MTVNDSDQVEAQGAAPPLLRPHTGSEPQHLLVTLLGDYWFARPEPIPSAALVGLLAEFGANETASRQAMRRLTAQGLLAHSKRGRATFYGIPSDIVDGQRRRLDRAIRFGEDFTDWDGCWTVVAFSIPEKERVVRRLLRTRLRAMKFGILQDGVWISPHNLESEASRVLDDLAVQRGHIMRAVWPFRSGTEAAISEGFDLQKLAEAYEDFIERHQLILQQATSSPLAPSQALIARTTLTNEWLSFRGYDPEMPVELLPPDWPRPRARELFIAVYDLLAPGAVLRFREVVAEHDPQLATLAEHHSSLPDVRS